MKALGHYFCTTCAVYGRGQRCWVCGSTTLERDTPRVDFHVYDWESEGTVHRSTVNGG